MCWIIFTLNVNSWLEVLEISPKDSGICMWPWILGRNVRDPCKFQRNVMYSRIFYDSPHL